MKKMLLEDSEEEDLIITFTPRKVFFDESKNQTYYISDECYLLNQAKYKLILLLQQKLL